MKDPQQRGRKKTAYPQHAWWWVATWFGCGLSPVVSGTVGSLGALPFAYAIHLAFGGMGLCIAALLMFLIGWWASERYLKHTGRTDDASEIVVDEVAGQWLLLAALYPTWQSYLAGFILFRAFDILKPWPVNVADRRIKGGLGIMLDDMLAAVYPLLIWSAVSLIAHATGAGAWLAPIMAFLGGGYVQ